MHALILQLLLLPALAVSIPYTATPALLPFVTQDASKYCKHTGTIPYHDQWGPMFIENAYICSFPAAAGLTVQPGAPRTRPLTRPLLIKNPDMRAPDNVDPAIASLGTLEPIAVANERARQQAAAPKLTIPAYGCALLPEPARLSSELYSNLFWAMRQLTNQTCLDPGEAKEFVDIRRTWTADWRFVVVNRGAARRCEWWQDVANVAEALHYVCYYSELGVGLQERSGGQEAVSWGVGEGLRWCLRYSSRGWGDDAWEEKCLGV